MLHRNIVRYDAHGVFEMTLEPKGKENGDYVPALDFVHRKSREEGIDAALGTGRGIWMDY